MLIFYLKCGDRCQMLIVEGLKDDGLDTFAVGNLQLSLWFICFKQCLPLDVVSLTVWFGLGISGGKLAPAVSPTTLLEAGSLIAFTYSMQLL